MERFSLFHFQLAEAGLSLLWDGMEHPTWAVMELPVLKCSRCGVINV